MPFTATVSNASRRLAVAPRATGGYDRAQRPDPNDPIDVYKRAVGPGLVTGQTGSTNLPTRSGATFVTNSGESALSQNVGLMQRADAQTAASETADRQRNMFTPIRTVPIDRRWAALHQALYEAGTDKVQTGASAGYAPRGFFDTQATMSTQARQRAELLKVMEVNSGNWEQAAHIEDMIRRGSGG